MNETSHKALPPYVVINHRIGELEKVIADMGVEIKDLGVELMTIQESVNASTNKLLEELKVCLDQLPRAVSESVSKNCQIKGAVPIASEKVQELLRNNFDNISNLILGVREEMKQISEKSTNSEGPMQPPQPHGPSQTLEDGYASFTWGGRVHMVPEGFELPSLNALNWWRAYWDPNTANRIQPLRNLKGFDIKSKFQKASWSKSKYLLKDMTQFFMEKEALSESDIRDMSPVPRNQLFQRHFEDYVLQKFCNNDKIIFNSLRFDALVLNTFYDKVKKHNIQFNGEKSTKRRKLN